MESMYHCYNGQFDLIAKEDPQVAEAMEAELSRQRRNIELIASENIVSPAVMAAMGSILTNKYAEGYPGKRYYGGCQCVDVVEDIAINRAKELFGAEHANVQPHSGAQANMAVYFALLQPGDTVLGMSLAHGGHLTHGSPVNISGKYFNFHSYGVNDDGFIDYDALEKTAKEIRPKLIVAGASAYPRIIDFERISNIAKEIGAYFMVDMAHIAGLVAAGLHPSPVPYADVVTSTTHKTLRGPRGGLILCKEELGAAINKAIFPGTQGGPLMHVIAAKAVCFGEALRPEFKEYQQRVVNNSKVLASALLEKGFDLVSGTDNHLMLVDLRPMKITGKELEHRLDEVFITVNKNAIPNDPEKPFVTSGIRIGTPAVTTRGFGEEEMKTIAQLIFDTATDFEGTADKTRETVNDMCRRFPLYYTKTGELWMSTIAAIATPLAAGGLGVIRISGEDAINIADKIFRPYSGKSLKEMKGYTAAYGDVFDGETKIDDAVALVFRAPKSYTGENVVEISCHGGVYVLTRALRAALNAGAEPAEPGEFTKRAFLNGKMDLTAAEAVMSVISAHGEQALSAARTALEGALGRKINEIADSLIKISAGFAVWTDYPEEDIPELDFDAVKGSLEEAKEALSELLSTFEAGQAITEGVRTVICGVPNVGKSSLMNLLCGMERSIVTDIPGTTRDVVEETVKIGNVLLRLADTAGVRDTEDTVENIGVRLAVKRMRDAGLILAVFDGSRELKDEDREFLKALEGKRAIAVINKADLEIKTDIEEIKKSIPELVMLSCKTGKGLDNLRETIEKLLGTENFDTTAPMLANERQRSCCQRALDAIADALEALEKGVTSDAVNVCIDSAINSLLVLTGRKASEAVVDEVFRSFCVGK